MLSSCRCERIFSVSRRCPGFAMLGRLSMSICAYGCMSAAFRSAYLHRTQLARHEKGSISSEIATKLPISCLFASRSLVVVFTSKYLTVRSGSMSVLLFNFYLSFFVFPAQSVALLLNFQLLTLNFTQRFPPSLFAAVFVLLPRIPSADG